MNNIIVMQQTCLKSDNSFLFKSSFFLGTLKYNNFVPSNLSIIMTENGRYDMIYHLHTNNT